MEDNDQFLTLYSDVIPSINTIITELVESAVQDKDHTEIDEINKWFDSNEFKEIIEEF